MSELTGAEGIVRNAAGRKSHPYGPLIRAFIGRLGAAEQGSEGSLRGMRGGEGFYSQGRAPI